MRYFQHKFSKSKAMLGLILLAILTSACQTTNSTADDQKGAPVNVVAMMEPFAPKVQTFAVSGKKPSTVTGKAGTKIHVQPKNLTLPDGSPISGDIEVKLVECTRKSEILGAGLQTVSDGKLLESGGSYYIDMQSQGQSLTIREGKSVDVEFPQISDKKMELFYGARDAEGQMNWEQTGTPFKEVSLPRVSAVGSPNSDSSMTVVRDTMYGYISGKDTIRSRNQQDIWDYIAAQEGKPASKKNVPMTNEEKRLKRKADAEQTNTDKIAMQNRKNEQSMGDRRTDADAKAAMEKRQRDAATAANERSRNRRANSQSMAAVEANSYGTLKLNRFGWINCDRFWQETNLAPVTVAFEESQKPALVYFVLKGESSILSKSYTGMTGQLESDPLPVGREIVVIAMTSDETGEKYTFAQSSHVVGDTKSLQLNLKPTSKDKIQAVFDAI